MVEMYLIQRMSDVVRNLKGSSLLRMLSCTDIGPVISYDITK